MAKANFTLPGGTTVTLDGEPEEVARLLALLPQATGGGTATRSIRRRTTGTARRPGNSSQSRRSGPTEFVVELREEGYFSSKRSLNDILKRLEEKGHIYARTSLSPVLVRLVRRRDLRRVKENGNWAYVS